MIKKLTVLMFAALLSFSGASAITSCSNDDVEATVQKSYFESWNKCEALTALQEYVEDVTNPKSPNYISEEDRIATFDMDGTFVGELYPTYFEYNLLEYRVLDDADYRDKAPEDVRTAAQNIRDFVRNGTALPDHFDMIHAKAAAKAWLYLLCGIGFRSFYLSCIGRVNRYCTKQGDRYGCKTGV